MKNTKPLRTDQLERGRIYRILINRDFRDDIQGIEHKKGELLEGEFVRASSNDFHCGLFLIGAKLEWIPVETEPNREAFTKLFEK